MIISFSNSVVLFYKCCVGHQGEVTCIYLDTEAHILVSGSEDKTVCTWDIDTECCTNIFRYIAIEGN